MTKLLVTFERIGRNHNVEPLTFDIDDRDCSNFDALVESIYRHAGKHLSSRSYEVDVQLDPDTFIGTVSIDYGRFGKGTIAPAPPE